MTKGLKQNIDELNNNYLERTGSRFVYFYCPILFKDEHIKICRGHIINKAFQNSSRKWIAQRADVDNFFGTYFEADFELIQYAGKHRPDEVITNPKLRKKLKPTLVYCGEIIQYYTAGLDLPASSEFSPARFVCEDKHADLILKLESARILGDNDMHLDIVIDKDIRIPSFISLLKSAHLTMFYIFKYNYALSAAGEYLGNQILGNFYRTNHNKRKITILDNALTYFTSFKHMVRPIIHIEWDLKGSVDDQIFLLCRGSSGKPWGLILFIKHSDNISSIMLPVFDNIDSIPTYLSFLKNDTEDILVSPCRYNVILNQWEVSTKEFKLHWSKRGQYLD